MRKLTPMAIIAGVLLLVATLPAYAVESTFSVTEDAYVQERRANTNKGVTSLKIFNDGKQINSYLKFDVSGIAGTVTSAKLRLKLRSNTPDAGMVYSVSNNLSGSATAWTEHNVTWNNAPALGTMLSSAPGAHAVNEIIEFDVTSAVAGNGFFSFAIQTSTLSSFKYNSKETGAAAELVITTGAAGGNLAPLANAGIDQTVTDADNSGAEMVILDGSSSSDVDGTIASYSWAEGGIQIAAGVGPTLSLAVGAHNITLTVMDNLGATASDALLITVNPAPPVGGGGATASFTAMHDAYVNERRGNTNKGVTSLKVEKDTKNTNSYLKFSVSGLADPVVSATLRLFVRRSGADGGMIYSVGNSLAGTATPWTERSITWNNAPALGALMGAAGGPVAQGDIIEIDVTAAVSGNGDISFAIQSDARTAMKYQSKETGSPAELLITTGVAPPTNQAPIANAGLDQNLADADSSGAEMVTLDGSGSTDADGTIASYSWSEGGVEIATGVGPILSLAVGIHTVTLTVTDDQGATSSDQIVITINAVPAPPANLAPIAAAGADQGLLDDDNNGSEQITLDGSGSTDADGTVDSYSWSDGGTEIATSVNPSINLSVGVHTITLTVTDDQGATGSDSVTVTVGAFGDFLLALTTDAGAGGTITPGVGFTVHAAGAVVPLTAAPFATHDFGFWSGDIVIGAFVTNPSVTRDSSMSIQANFFERPSAAGEVIAGDVGFSGALAAYGPNHAYGFPTYYTDANGLSLVQAIDRHDPFLPSFSFGAEVEIPDVNAPLNVANENFFGESFYFIGNATMPTGAGTALLILALEAVFGGPVEQVLPGDQTVFSRVRFRVDLPNGGIFTITFPWGEVVFDVPAGGGRAINFTADGLHGGLVPEPCAGVCPSDNPITQTTGPGTGEFFDSPMDGARAYISTYLQWDPPGSAPAGYVGDVSIAHAVTGSPTGFNKFRIEGPNVGGPGIDMIETDLFNIGGKIIEPVAAPAPVANGDTETAQDEGVLGKAIAKPFALHQNVPNPFNPNTKIRFSLPRATHVDLAVYDVAGRRVRTLLREGMSSGDHSVTWNGKNEYGNQVSSGLYFYKMVTPEIVEVRKMMMMK